MVVAPPVAIKNRGTREWRKWFHKIAGATVVDDDESLGGPAVGGA